MDEEDYITIHIPRSIVTSAKIPKRRIRKIARIELAIALYSRGILSLGQARKLAGFTKWEFLAELAKRGVERHYTEEELEDDIKFAKD